MVAGCSGTGALTESQRLQAQAFHERGVVSLNDGRFNEALASLQQAIALDGTVAVYHNSLGVLYLQMQRPDLALERFRRGSELDPSYADGHLNTGIALAELGRWPEAVEAYRRALAQPTLLNQYGAYQNLGVALFHVKDLRGAEEALRFAIGLDPEREAAVYNLGLVLMAQDRRAEAKVAFQRTRALAPESPFGQAALQRLRALGDGG
jgi:superkiller protein 3